MPGQGATRGAPAGGALLAKQWAVVYTGPKVKCCTIKFVSVSDPSKEGGTPAIGIYVDGDQQANLAKSLAVGQSLEVCGKAIRVYGVLRGAQVAQWETSEDEATDWFE